VIYYRDTAPLKVFLFRVDELDYGDMFKERNEYGNYRFFRQNAPLHWEKHHEWCHAQCTDESVSMFRVHIFSGMKDNMPYSARIGTVGLTSIDYVNRRAEFSIVLASEYKGAGFGRDALLSLLGHGFLDLGMNVIWGEVFETNPALDKFLSLGFKLEGKRRDFYYRDGRHIDACLISITRDEFDDLYSLERIATFPGNLKPAKAGRPVERRCPEEPGPAAS
jgi:RimJ/RimL family protein N-acetyltransferase